MQQDSTDNIKKLSLLRLGIELSANSITPTLFLLHPVNYTLPPVGLQLICSKTLHIELQKTRTSKFVVSVVIFSVGSLDTAFTKSSSAIWSAANWATKISSAALLFISHRHQYCIKDGE